MSTTTAKMMPYVRLGKSGLKVSKLILGCMGYGSPNWQGWVVGPEQGIEQIKLAYDLGINAFDTADVYSNGYSEVILGKAIKQHNLPRDEIVVMTKAWFPINRDINDPSPYGLSEEELYKLRLTNRSGSSRKHLFDAIKASLGRLELDYVDVFQCHRFDPETPIEETMHALHDIVQAGYARYIGMSSCYAWQFQKMQNYARANGLTEFVSMQNFHNAVYREEEREMVPLLQDLGVGMIPWSPLGRGFLTRPVNEETDRGKVDAMFIKYAVGDPAEFPFLATINERVHTIAKARNVSMAQVALAWSLSKPFITAPIVGTTNVEKLKDLVAGLELTLTEEEVKSIDEAYMPRRISGHT